MHPLLLAAAAFTTAAVGALGGLGGAILLVPMLVISGVSTRTAAPLGMISVASGSLAAAPLQLRDRLVNHRLGVATETVGALGALIGALVSGVVGQQALAVVLGVVALIAAVVGLRRKGIRNLPDPALSRSDVGEAHGTLSGVYALDGESFVPYRVNRLVPGFLGTAVAGVVSGLSGVGGGFIRTPILSEVMHVPVKVAAATSSFTVGVTASVALIVFATQGRIELHDALIVALASMVGGAVGVRLQSLLPPPMVRRALALVLIVIGCLLVVRR